MRWNIPYMQNMCQKNRRIRTYHCLGVMMVLILKKLNLKKRCYIFKKRRIHKRKRKSNMILAWSKYWCLWRRRYIMHCVKITLVKSSSRSNCCQLASVIPYGIIFKESWLIWKQGSSRLSKCPLISIQLHHKYKNKGFQKLKLMTLRLLEFLNSIVSFLWMLGGTMIL